MENWRMLGIDPTKDVSLIKKSYAKKLKIYHPENDPEGYQRLREAYETSLWQAKQVQTYSAFESEQEEIHFLISQQDDMTEQQSKRDGNHQLQVFMKDVETLYNDFFSRIQEENWITLLNSELVWDVNQKSDLQYSLLSFFENYHYLPHSVWLLFDNIFDWSNQTNLISEQFNQEFAEYLLHQISGSKEMSYYFFKEMDHFNYDEYLKLREEILNHLMEGNLEVAKGFFEKAFELYAEDPDLLRMYGVFHLQQADEISAQDSFTNALIHNPMDFDSFIFRAQIQYRSGQYEKVIKDCENLLSSESKNEEALSLIGKCHYQLGNVKEARHYFDLTLDVLDDLEDFEDLDEFVLEEGMYLDQSYYPALGGIGSDPHTASHKTLILNFCWWLTLMFIARNWIYLLLFFLLEIFTSLPLIITAILFVPVTWEVIKQSKVERLMLRNSQMNSKPVEQKSTNALNLYLRCLSSICVKSYVGYSAFYTHHEFAPIRDIWLRRRSLKKELKRWDIHNNYELKKKIDWHITEGYQHEFNQIRRRLSVLSLNARSAYIESNKEHLDYHKMIFVALGIYKIRPSGIAAFDIAWSIYFCRIGRALGHIDKDYALEIMIKAAQKAQQSYTNWNEYMTAYFLGRHFAEGETKLEYDESTFYYIRHLFNSLSTPLKVLNWNYDLLKDYKVNKNNLTKETNLFKYWRKKTKLIYLNKK